MSTGPPTYVFNSVLKFLLGHPIIAVLIVAIIIAFIFGGFNWYFSRKYDKQRAEYETNSKAWATEKAQLLGGIAERDKAIEQLKAKEAVIIAADQAGKKLDDALATKIDEVTKAAAEEATATDGFTDCWVRGDRTCAKLAALKPPIRIDCDAYKRKICSGQ